MNSKNHPGNKIEFRPIRDSDLKDVVALLSEDLAISIDENQKLSLNQYQEILTEINADSNNEIIVATLEDQIIGCLQLTFIPCLTLNGTKRAQIEGVRIQKYLRNQGIGRSLIQFAIDRSKSRNAKLIQLNSNKSRKDAIRFYEQFGFSATHEGFKLYV